MKKDLLQFVVCPSCRGKLDCQSFSEAQSGEVENGLLTCQDCRGHFPVIDGIPRLLPPSLRSMLRDTNPEFFKAYQKQLDFAIERLANEQNSATLLGGPRFPEIERAVSDRDLAEQVDTARSFGYEWQQFSEMLPEYEKNFRWYFERFSAEAFSGKRVLDAGCGTGRHTFHVARNGAREVIAMDLSQAIEVAARNNRQNANTHFIQADIYHPPFPPASFDFVYSLGVLHHLPDPEKGFRTLLPLLRADGFINVYLYWNLKGEALWRRVALAAVTQARRISTRLPHALLKKLSWAIAAGFQVALMLPARALDRFALTRPLADRIPLGHYRKYSFRVLYTDQFDRFSAPIENRYSQAQVAEWFGRAGLEDVVILGGAGWRASGRKSARLEPIKNAKSTAGEIVSVS